MKITTAYDRSHPIPKRGQEKCKEGKDKDCKDGKDKEMREVSPYQVSGIFGGSFRYTEQIAKKG